ncbi:hypothetical protein [Deefgea rivuli]|uniref:hypothetical protein n=1 Tax=Deefgea rivuli TaxID=400948 RepID=UPI0004894B3E|nr:hypothetical protein [Deefgea rivuli]
MSKPDKRFDLSAIDDQKAIIEQAKIDARKPQDRRSVGRLVALTNVPWLIGIVAWVWWAYFK